MPPVRGSIRCGKATRYSALLAVLWLSGCAQVPKPESVANPSAALATYQDRLAELNHWSFSGRLSLTQGSRRWFAGIHWQQAQGDFTLHLTGPFGGRVATLTGSPASVTLDTDDGERYLADSADQLLATQFGQPIPVEGLRYWVRGVPAPTGAFTVLLDSQGRIEQLSQQGWAIGYPTYYEGDHHRQPKKIFLQNSELEVRLVIDEWIEGVAEDAAL